MNRLNHPPTWAALVVFTAFVGAVSGPARVAKGVGSETFSVDITNILYTTGIGEFAIDDSFDTDTQSVSDIVLIGSAAVSDPHGVASLPQWLPEESGPGVFGGSLVSRSGDIVLRTSATGDPKNPLGDDEGVSAGRYLGPGTVLNSRITNESHLAFTADAFVVGNDTPNIAYAVEANLEDENQSIGFATEAIWFTGWFDQTYFDHGLAFTMSVYQWGSDPNIADTYLWDSEIVIVPGPFDPATTEIQVGMDLIQGSSTDFSGWYRINGGSLVVIDSNTFPGLDIFSFTETNPGVFLDMAHVPIPGDINGDDSVDIADLALVGAQWDTPGSPPFNADVSPPPYGDGSVDIGDLALVGANWTGATFTSSLSGGVAVPLPGAGMAGLAMLSVIVSRRRGCAV